jgi:putative addiction module killer protein
MAVEMVLNNLSFPFPVEEGVARRLMTELISVLSVAKNVGVKVLRTEDNLYNLLLSDNYPMSAWLNDRQVEREERTFLLTLVTKTPLLTDITDSAIQDKEIFIDFQGKQAYALGIAYLLNALAISFNSDPKWDCDSLNLEITQLESESEKLTTNVERLIHASRREHILGHKPQIQYRLRAEPWHPQDEWLPCYITADGRNHLAEWLDSLSDLLAKEIIQVRLNQVKQGTLGDYKSVGEGVWELRIFYGPAYRIYFGQITTTQSLLLCGGNKSTQAQDIIKAKQHWQNYKQQNRL